MSPLPPLEPVPKDTESNAVAAEVSSAMALPSPSQSKQGSHVRLMEADFQLKSAVCNSLLWVLRLTNDADALRTLDRLRALWIPRVLGTMLYCSCKRKDGGQSDSPKDLLLFLARRLPGCQEQLSTEAKRWSVAPRCSFVTTEGHAEFLRRLQSVVNAVKCVSIATGVTAAGHREQSESQRQEALRRRITILQMEMNKCMSALQE